VNWESTDNTIEWCDNFGERHYDTGIHPTVDIRGNQILEAHCAHTDDVIWSHVGRLDPDNKKIMWKDASGDTTYSCPFDGGYLPSVCLGQLGVIAVHRASTDGSIWYQTGKENNTVMVWGPSNLIVDQSISDLPAAKYRVSVATNNNGVYILGYSNNYNESLSFRVGILQ
jgi:hypothetical protein